MYDSTFWSQTQLAPRTSLSYESFEIKLQQKTASAVFLLYFLIRGIIEYMQRIFIVLCFAILLVLGVVLYWRADALVVAPFTTNTIETDFYTISVTQPKDAEKNFPELFAVTKKAINEFEKQYGNFNEEDIEKLNLGEKTYDLQIDTTVATSSKTVSYIVSMYQYTGGAHGSTVVKAFTYNKDSHFVGERELFGENNWRPMVSDLAYQYLKEKLKENTTDEVLKEGTTPTGENLSVWYLKGEDVVFVFGQYQIGPYVLGIQEVPIPREKLQSVLINSY